MLKKIAVKAHLRKHYDYEEGDVQDVLIDVIAEIEGSHYTKLEQTLDYGALEQEIVDFVAKLDQVDVLEHLAGLLAELVLRKSIVKKVTISISKIGVMQNCAEACVSIEKSRQKVFLALGSNVGDRVGHIKIGIEAIKLFVDIAKVSSIKEYPALLPEGSTSEWNMPYMNCVLWGYTELCPKQLLQRCQSVEFGRQTQRWAPRELDVDIILYDNKIVIGDNIAVPHPEFLKRSFVMEPMQEIAPEMFILYGPGEI